MNIDFKNICCIYTVREWHNSTGEFKSKDELKSMFKDCTYRYNTDGSIYVCERNSKNCISVIEFYKEFLDKLVEDFIDNEV